MSDVTTTSLNDDFANPPKNIAEKECQTTDGVYLSNSEYHELLKKASLNPGFQNDLQKIKTQVSTLVQPEMKLCNGCHLHNVVFSLAKMQFLSSCFIKNTATLHLELATKVLSPSEILVLLLT